MYRFTSKIVLISLGFTLSFAANSQTENTFMNGDLLPDAPLLATRGDYAVGVQSLELINKDQIDILHYEKGEDVLYDRRLTVEVWYPAALSDDEEEIAVYNEVMGAAHVPDRPVIPFTFEGRAARNAKPLLKNKSFPLVIVSHGYPGSRFLLTYLTENLASKGYVVVAIDHTESTYSDVAEINSTLLNRSLDDLFVLNEIARLSTEKESFLVGLVDANNTALIGYSMGGYGVVNVAGAGYSPQAVGYFSSVSNGNMALEVRANGHPEFEASIDPRVKAIVALAPWGMNYQAWNADGLAGIKIPSFFIAGSEDDISGYENGIKAIYEGAVNSDRYLLTYLNARHNIAPNPPPPAVLKEGLHLDEYLRYADSVWDQRRLNNLNQHFITAFLGIHLKNIENYNSYLDVDANTDKKEWTGFKPRTWVGMELIHSNKKE